MSWVASSGDSCYWSISEEISSAGHSVRILVLIFDVPFPTDYGGVYDVSRRLSFLKSAGYQVDLLCLVRDKYRISEFKKWMESLITPDVSQAFILHTPTKLRHFFALRPASVCLRDIHIPAEFIEKLTKRSYAALLVEHLKTWAVVAHLLKYLFVEQVWLRLHNDEAEYHEQLALRSRSTLKKVHYFVESRKYFYFQRKVLASPELKRVFYISKRDMFALEKYSTANQSVLPIYFDLKKVAKKSLPAKFDEIVGVDFLYVGNLDSDDNYESILSALHYLKNLGFTKAPRIVVCGRCTSSERGQSIRQTAEKLIMVNIEFNVTQERLEELYAVSKIFLNFSQNAGGVKTKFIDALSRGMLVLSNDVGVSGSGLDDVSLLDSRVSKIDLEMLLLKESFYESTAVELGLKLEAHAESIRLAYYTQLCQ